MRCVFSLAVGHCGVLNKGEVVGDVLVVRQPPVGPNQAVLTHRHLEKLSNCCLSSIQSFFLFTTFFSDFYYHIYY